MSNDPIVNEQILNGVKKDLTIENIQRLMLQYKTIADAWSPKVSFEYLPDNMVKFTIIVGDQNNSETCQGLTYTLSHADIIYLADGNTFVEELSSNFATLYEGMLRGVIRQAVGNLPENLKMQGKHK